MFKFFVLFALVFSSALAAPHYVSPLYNVPYYGYNYPVATSYSNRYDYYPYSKGKF